MTTIRVLTTRATSLYLLLLLVYGCFHNCTITPSPTPTPTYHHHHDDDDDDYYYYYYYYYY